MQSLLSSLETLLSTNEQASLFLERYLMQLSKDQFKLCIDKIQFYISMQLESDPNINTEIIEAIEVLNVFNKANNKREPRDQVDYTLFYNDEINKLENL